MSDPNVVVRLLAAIDEPEKAEIRSRVHTYLKWRLDGSATDRFRVACRHCDWATVGAESDVAPLAGEHAVRCVSMPISPVLRLCQSHRDIVALHKITVTSSESFDPMAERRVTDHDVECEVCGWCSDDPKEACATLTALARGYGIEDGEG